MNTRNLITFFKEVPLFSHLDEEELEQLTHICTEKSFEKGQTIFYEEDMGTGFYLIIFYVYVFLNRISILAG